MIGQKIKKLLSVHGYLTNRVERRYILSNQNDFFEE